MWQEVQKSWCLIACCQHPTETTIPDLANTLGSDQKIDICGEIRQNQMRILPFLHFLTTVNHDLYFFIEPFSLSICLGQLFIISTCNQTETRCSDVCLAVCMCIYLSTCLFWSVIFFSFIVGRKIDWTLLRSIHMLKYNRLSNHCSSTCLSMQRHQIVWTVYSRTFPRKEIYTLYFLMATHAVLCLFPGSSKSLCIYFFFFFFFFTSATQHCTPRTNQLFLPPEKSVLEKDNETKLGFMWLTHFEGPHSYLQITYCIFFSFFFSYCDDNCVSPNKPSSNGFPRRRLFGES